MDKELPLVGDLVRTSSLGYGRWEPNSKYVGQWTGGKSAEIDMEKRTKRR